MNRTALLCQVFCLLSCAIAFNIGSNQAKNNSPSIRVDETNLHLFKFFRRRSKTPGFEPAEPDAGFTDAEVAVNDADVVIIGGGVSGLTAAITAAETAKKKSKVVLLEAHSELGGRVKSEKTEDGYVLDEGFAVFIEG